MKKTFLLDTNVLMQAPDCIFGFDDNDLIITPTTLEELDKHKNDYGESGFNARESIRILGELKDKGNFKEGILTQNGGMIRVEFNHVKEVLPEGWDVNKPDNRILQCALALKEKNVILVSNDINMQIKASIIGIAVQSYKNTRVSEDSIKYNERKKIYVMPNLIETKFKKGLLLPEDVYNYDDIELNNNDFVIIHNAVQENSTLLGMYRKGFIQPLRYASSRPSDVSPRNVGQYFAQEALMMPASEAPLVILKGPAGTAKTFYSLAVGLEQVTNLHNYKTLLMTRPNIKFDEDIGFLKGDEMEKILPLIRPCYDNLEQLLTHDDDTKDMSDSKVEYLFRMGKLKAEAMAYMRGRSLKKMFLLIDECQNSTPNQMLGLITRAGVDTKVVITGDINQIDNPKLDKKNNGLSFASERMRGSDLCVQVTFEDEECERSELSQEAAQKLSTSRLI